MNVQPQQLELINPDTLQIEWSDGETRQYRVDELRANCPCASCLEKKKAPPLTATSLPVITSAEAQPLRIASMQPMGRYAYGIRFSDGHDTGLYTLESLRELGTVIEA